MYFNVGCIFCHQKCLMRAIKFALMRAIKFDKKVVYVFYDRPDFDKICLKCRFCCMAHLNLLLRCTVPNCASQFADTLQSHTC